MWCIKDAGYVLLTTKRHLQLDICTGETTTTYIPNDPPPRSQSRVLLFCCERSRCDKIIQLLTPFDWDGRGARSRTVVMWPLLMPLANPLRAMVNLLLGRKWFCKAGNECVCRICTTVSKAVSAQQSTLFSRGEQHTLYDGGVVAVGGISQRKWKTSVK
jgi:hypothetical protein